MLTALESFNHRNLKAMEFVNETEIFELRKLGIQGDQTEKPQNCEVVARC